MSRRGASYELTMSFSGGGVPSTGLSVVAKILRSGPIACAGECAMRSELEREGGRKGVRE
eukprot:1351359-Pleurochrysis_carterae.AAC.1